jgi:hypothetical protein
MVLEATTDKLQEVFDTLSKTDADKKRGRTSFKGPSNLSSWQSILRPTTSAPQEAARLECISAATETPAAAPIAATMLTSAAADSVSFSSLARIGLEPN